MTEAPATVPQPSSPPGGAYGRPAIPRTFSHKSWKAYRFTFEQYYRARIPGEPTLDQLEVVAGMANALFNAYKQEQAARRSTGRESREAAGAADRHRYTFTKLLERFERSIAKTPQPSAATLADVLRSGGSSE